MVILGIDPGLAITGYGLIEIKKRGGRGGAKIQMIDFGCVKTSAKTVFAQRLEIIYDQLQQLVKKYQPDKIAIEKLFFAKNVKTAMQVGEARGVVTLVAIQNKIPIAEFTPLQVKQALTGYGQASKDQIQKMIKAVLGLKEAPKSDDSADALAIAITCSQTRE